MPLKASAREGAGQAPLHAAAVALADRGDDLHAQVRRGLHEAADELPHALRSEGVDLTADVLASAGRPQRDSGLDIAFVDGPEVAARDGLRAARGAAALGR